MKRADPKHLCGAAVTRCTVCANTVAKARLRRGQSCPKHPDAPTTPGTCQRAVTIEGARCKTHGGSAPQTVAVRHRLTLRAEAATQLARLGVAIETTPVETLEAMLCEAAGNVAVLRSLIADLPLQAGRPANPETGVEAADGIYGPLYHQSGVPTGEAKPHILTVMYDQERDRLAKLAEACVKLGLDERRIRLAETQVDRLLAAVTATIADIGLTVEQTGRFKQVLAGRIRGGQ